MKIMSPMLTTGWFDEDAVISDRIINYYEERAKASSNIMHAVADGNEAGRAIYFAGYALQIPLYCLHVSDSLQKMADKGQRHLSEKLLT